LNIPAVGCLTQLEHPTVEVGVGSGQFTLLHHPDFIVCGPSNLVRNRRFASTVANAKALDAVLDKLAVGCNVTGFRI
jgi:hypothetical protein